MPFAEDGHASPMNTGAHIVDTETASTVARRVRARARRCWRNAATAVHHLGPAARYVEGWVIVHPRDPYVIEHGWCEVDGRIVDPSYTEYVTRGLSPLDPPLAYFPGYRYSPRAAASALTKNRLPIAWNGGDGPYEAAFREAWREVATRTSAPGNPVRTQLVNCRTVPFDVFIGRPSKWASPFHFDRDGSREAVIARYRHWLIRQPLLLRDVQHLRGKVLGCNCPPRRCHGEILVELANVHLGAAGAAGA